MCESVFIQQTRSVGDVQVSQMIAVRSGSGSVSWIVCVCFGLFNNTARQTFVLDELLWQCLAANDNLMFGLCRNYKCKKTLVL